MTISSNAGEVARQISQRARKIPIGVDKAVSKWGLLLQTKIKANAGLPASGPPGPRIQTSDYNRSWNIRRTGNATHRRATVGTNKPQGKRLEYGFVGTDSLGRHYNQPPYPHVGPAVQEITGPFLADLGKALEQ